MRTASIEHTGPLSLAAPVFVSSAITGRAVSSIAACLTNVDFISSAPPYYEQGFFILTFSCITKSKSLNPTWFLSFMQPFEMEFSSYPPIVLLSKNNKKQLLFADAIKVLGGTDEQAAISDGNRRLNWTFIYFCLEDNLELIAPGGEHYDFAGFVDTVEFAICAGQ